MQEKKGILLHFFVNLEFAISHPRAQRPSRSPLSLSAGQPPATTHGTQSTPDPVTVTPAATARPHLCTPPEPPANSTSVTSRSARRCYRGAALPCHCITVTVTVSVSVPVVRVVCGCPSASGLWVGWVVCIVERIQHIIYNVPCVPAALGRALASACCGPLHMCLCRC